MNINPQKTARGNAFLFALLVLGLGLGLIQGQLQAQGQSIPQEVLAYPEMILWNGQVITADDNFRIAEALAIRGNEIMAVGTDAEIERLAGPQTQRIDLQGRSVLPGMLDTHLHQAWVVQLAKGGPNGRVAFTSVSSGLPQIEEIVAKAKPGEWL